MLERCFSVFRLLPVFLLAFLVGGTPMAAAAEPPASAAPALTPAEAQHAIEALQDPAQRARLIETLKAIAKAAPEPAPALAPDSLAAQLWSQLALWPELLAAEAASTVQAATDFPLLWSWAQRVAADPGSRDAAANALWHLVLVLLAALLLEWGVRRILARPMAALTGYAPRDNGADDASEVTPRHFAGAAILLKRLPFALARLVLELLPVGVFWAAGSLFSAVAALPSTRAAILVVVSAYAVFRLVIAFAHMLVSPRAGRLRLLQIDDAAADYLIFWLWWLALIAIAGSALAELALLSGLGPSAHDALIRFIGLIVAVLLGTLVWRGRRSVAARLRPWPDAIAEPSRWRLRLAGAWHYLALIAIAAGWIVWAAGVQRGLGSLRLLLGTLAIIVTARLVAIVLFGIVGRAAHLHAGPESGVAGGAARAARYQRPARLVFGAVIVAATAVVLLEFWGAGAFTWFAAGRIGGRLLSALLTIAVAAVAAIVVWEAANAALERRLTRLSEAGSAAHSARLRTLLPMLRAALLTTILTIVGLTALSEIGVNIAPLLAGAGIVGIAVGFGAQKLVQDVITGMFVLLENEIQIGDYVTVAGLSGTVERLSIRNIWLRGADGAVNIVPFSAVSTITNTNRGLGNAAVSVTVAYGEDSGRVTAALAGIVAEMREDPALAPLILGEPQLWVDAVKAGGVTYVGLIPCSDVGRLPVQHEFNRRLQQRFQELGITLAG